MKHLTEYSAAISALLLAVAQGAEVKVRNFTVNPSTGPLGAVDVVGDWKGAVTLTPPAGWVIEPQTMNVEGGQAPFRVVKATENAQNRYLFGVVADGKVQTQAVSVASAPYGKLVTDGKPDTLWKDGIPLDWKTADKKTVLRMFWTEDNIYLAIEMEGGLRSLRYGFGTIKKSGAKVYYEFETDAAGKTARCSLKEGHVMKTALEAKAAVVSEKGGTVAEIELPIDALDGIRFDAGREFYFSLIVMDSEGRIRDLGERMNRPACAKRKEAWLGIAAELYDAWGIFGCCSSIH